MRVAIGSAALAAFAVISYVALCDQQVDVTMRNQQVIRQNLEKINRGDAKGAAADWAEDAQNFGRPAGPERIQRIREDITATFPDYHMEVVEMVAVGDVVVVRCNVNGTHRGVGRLSVNGGMLVGVQPTGKRFEIAHIHWYKLRDGKIVEQWATRDDLGMMRQLGLLPSNAGVSTR
jgi:predicted ester cyclase